MTFDPSRLYTIQEFVAQALVHRESHLLPVVVPKLVQALLYVPQEYWLFHELPGPDDRPILAIECTLGKTVFDSETCPYQDPIASKFVAFDCDGCRLGFILRDRTSEWWTLQVSHGKKYRTPDFIEHVMEFLINSGVMMQMTESRAKAIHDLGNKGSAKTEIKYFTSQNERDEAMKSSSETDMIFSELRPKLPPIQDLLTSAILVADKEKRAKRRRKGQN